jgi:prepilin-type N-terminal cleavage/methylation domain-containing protein
MSGQRGFSLIEVLVALALTTLVAAVLFVGIGLGFKAVARIEDSAGTLDTRRHVETVLRRQLATAYPAFGSLTTAPTFVGAPSAMTFLALESLDGPGLYRIWLVHETDGTLVLARQALAGGGIERAVLARGVVGLHFAYFGAPTRAAERTWHDRWEGSRGLPELVGIRLALAGDVDTDAPEEIVRLWTGEVQR